MIIPPSLSQNSHHDPSLFLRLPRYPSSCPPSQIYALETFRQNVALALLLHFLSLNIKNQQFVKNPYHSSIGDWAPFEISSGAHRLQHSLSMSFSMTSKDCNKWIPQLLSLSVPIQPYNFSHHLNSRPEKGLTYSQIKAVGSGHAENSLWAKYQHSCHLWLIHEDGVHTWSNLHPAEQHSSDTDAAQERNLREESLDTWCIALQKHPQQGTSRIILSQSRKGEDSIWALSLAVSLQVLPESPRGFCTCP
jgi:hypothetical protein